MRQRGIRVDVDFRNEKMQAKIRDAQLAKIPYMAVVGAREAEHQQVAVRHRRDGDLGAMGLDAFLERVQKEQASRATA